MPFKHHLSILLVYSFLTLVMSGPGLAHLTDSVAGFGGDAWQTMWRFNEKWNGLTAATMRGEFTSYLADEFAGAGPARLVNLSVWPWMWLHLLFGQPAAYNIVWFLSFVLSGYGMFLLADYLTHSKKNQNNTWVGKYGSSALAGLAYMFLPYHVAHSYGHFGAMQTQWLPLIILLMFTIINRPTFIKAAILLLLLTMQAWSEHHYFLWWIVFSVIFIVFNYRQIKHYFNQPRSYPIAFGLTFGLLVLVALPYRPTAALAWPDVSDLKLGLEQTINFSADVFSYLVPAFFHPWWGSLSNSLFSQHFTGNKIESTMFLGIAPLLLVIFFQAGIPAKEKHFWFVTALIFWLFSLGPWLHLLGQVTVLPLPYWLLTNLPVFDIVRAVGRAAVLVNIAWMVLLAWVLKINLHRGVSLAALTGIVLVEFLFWPYPTQSFKTPAIYELVKNLPGKTIIELPAATDYTSASKALYGTLIHQKEVLGNIALERAAASQDFKTYRSWPALRQVLYMNSDQLTGNRREFFGQDMAETFSDVSRWQEIGAIIVHKNEVAARQYEAVNNFLSNTLALKTRVVDEDILYELAALPSGDGVFLGRDEKWQNVFYDQKNKQDRAEIAKEANLLLYNTTSETKIVHMSWQVPAAQEPSLTYATGARYFTDWRQQKRLLKLDVVIPVGLTTITIKNNADAPAIFINPRMQVFAVDS